MKRKTIYFITIIIMLCITVLTINYNINNITKLNNTIESDTDQSSKYTVAIEEYIDDAAIMIPEIMYKEKFYRDDNAKYAYLTFDDGPSDLVTNKILDVLEENNIKATFFLLGKSIEENAKSIEAIKRIYREGHSIGNHGYCHNYNVLYPNGIIDIEAFLKDIEQNERSLKGILGEEFNTRLIRFPGGHYSWDISVDIDERLQELGYYYLDWNVSNDDCMGINKTEEDLLKSLKETLQDKDMAIVLMHDTNIKETTATSLQSVIDYLKKSGYKFRTIK